MNPIKFYQELQKEKKARLEDADRRNPKRLPTKFQVTIRIIVGAYLYYLVYTMVRNNGLNTLSGATKVLCTAAVVIFVICGGYFVVKGLLDLKNHRYFDPLRDDFSEPAEGGTAESAESSDAAECVDAAEGVDAAESVEAPEESGE